MFRNLEAEMARNGVTKVDIAELLGVRYATVIDKTRGRSRFYVSEALKIQKKFFPKHEIAYLFDSSEK